MSKTAQTGINEDAENVNGAGPTGGAPLARQGQSRDIYAGRNGQVLEHRQDGWASVGQEGQLVAVPSGMTAQG